MLALVVLRRTCAVRVVGEYIFMGFWLLAEAVEFQMISGDVGEGQKLGQKCPKGRKGCYERWVRHDSHVDGTLFQQLSPIRAGWRWK